MKLKTILSVALLVLVVLQSCCASSSAQSQAIITLDPATTYQTVTGWEAGGYAADEPGHSASFPLYVDELADQAVNDLGIDRVRLEIYPVTENPVDYGAQYLNGDISEYEFIHERAHQIINDNVDPTVINPDGFHFTYLDHKVDHIVLPLKQRLEARAEALHVNLNFVDFGSSAFELCDHPDEYGEFMLAVFQHLESKYGFVPDAIEVILEPNLADCWGSGTTVGNALVAAGQRLAANGYTPDFIAPSDSVLTSALGKFDQMEQNVPEALQYLTEFSYHCYWSGCTDDNLLGQVASLGVQYDIGTSMLEWWTSAHTYHTLHKGLKIGNNSAWQQGVLAGVGDPNNDPTFFRIIETDPINPQVILNHGTKYFRQYYKFIRKGAVRIEATTNNGNFDPLAFVNADGTYVVVVDASGGGAFSVQGLPAGTYGIKYTTGSPNNPPVEYDVDLPDATISSGQALSASIPTRGVITVYARASTTPTPPDSVVVSGPTTGLVQVGYTFTATVSPVTASLPMTYAWEATNQTPVTQTGGLNDAVTFAWDLTGTKTITVTATNAGGAVAGTHVISIVPGYKIYLPLILRSWS